MISRVIRAGFFAAALVLVAGCQSEARKVATEDGSGANASKCTRCHGGLESSGGAPPRSVKGETATTSRSVGAHTAHVLGGTHLVAPLGCDACHPEPSADAPMAHVNSKLELSFGVLARAGGVTPAWNPDTATCTVYCHGASMAAAGGDAKPPVWTTVNGTQGDCGSCHATPPPSPHPQRTDCARCHPGSMTLAGATTPPANHLNGQLDLQLGCTSCHGDEARAGTELQRSAPPTDTAGSSDTADRGVGAHQKHVLGGALAGPMACDGCHVVPTDPSHPDGTVQLQFTGVAVTGGLVPTFTPGSNTCSSTWCHGASLASGTNRAPAWTTVDGSQAACGTCHGAPPQKAPHTPSSTGCSVCHPGTVNADGTINVAGGRHVNGTVEVDDVHPADWVVPANHGYAANADLASCKECHGADLTGGKTGISCDTCHAPTWRTDCTFCHGEPNRAANKPAPPVGTQGELATTATAVGAHQRHLGGGSLRGPLACTECHAVPANLDHVTGTVQLTWGPIATAQGSTPAFTAQATCTASWCHGGGIGGGANKEPFWTKVDGTQASCGTCHGVPPPSPHTSLTTCKSCHPETISAGMTIDVAGGKHVNGTVEAVTYHAPGWSVPTEHGLAANADLANCKLCHGADLAGGTVGIACATCHGQGWQSNCAFCHGDGSRAGSLLLKAAPPQGSQNETATTARAVGAHQAHVTAGSLFGATGCETCHAVPTNLDHVNQTAVVAFTGVANADGPAATWSGTTCATYCHGASLAGGTNKTPAWTTVDGTQAACGACHGVAPPSPHPQNATCGKCHGGYTSGTVNLTSHVNGALELDALTCASCHGDPDRAGTDQQKAAPPLGTAGESSTANRAVGAHQAHVYGSRWSNGFACTECHTVPTELVHADGTVQTVFTGGISNQGGTSTIWNGNGCSASYCHGAGKSGAGWDGTAETPAWTGGPSQANCGTCHASPGTLRTLEQSIHEPHLRNDMPCATCHGDGYTSTAVNRSTHANGAVNEVATEKYNLPECHGGQFRGKPQSGLTQ